MKLPIRHAAILIGIALGAGSSWGLAADLAADAPTDAQKATTQKAVETCAACHGLNGRSISPTFPNLAAQTAPYIELQLHAFKDQTRADPDAQAYMCCGARQNQSGVDRIN